MPALRSPQHSLPPTPSTKGSGKSLSGQESLNDIDGSMSHEDMDRCKDVFRAYDKDGA